MDISKCIQQEKLLDNDVFKTLDSDLTQPRKVGCQEHMVPIRKWRQKYSFDKSEINFITSLKMYLRQLKIVRLIWYIANSNSTTGSVLRHTI